MPSLPLPLFLKVRHSELNLPIEDTYDLFGTKKRFTRQVNTPERINLETLLRLAFRIQVHPLTLIEDYNMGKLMITQDDRVQLRDHYSLTPTALRDETRHTHSSPAAGPQVAGANP